MTLQGLLIFADASRATGVGHYVRCSALAIAAAERGWKVTVGVQPDTLPWVTREVVSRGWQPQTLSRELSLFLAEVESLSTRFDHLVVVIDTYRVDSDWLRALHTAGLGTVILIDDLADRTLHADVVVNQNFGAENLPIQTEQDTEVLAGTHFALLRPEFALNRATGLANLDRLPVVPQAVLVLMGGTDPTGSSMAAAAACATAFPDAEITVVSNVKEACGPRIRVVERLGEDDVVSAMLSSDLVVTAAGSTLWELICLAKPVAALQVAENQRGVYALLSHSGVVHGLGSAPVDIADMVRKLQALVAKPDGLRKLAQASASLVDGLGAQRVIERVERRLVRQRP